jgi:hypothetical protein
VPKVASGGDSREMKGEDFENKKLFYNSVPEEGKNTRGDSRSDNWKSASGAIGANDERGLLSCSVAALNLRYMS